MNTSTIERFAGFDSATQLRHIASNLSRLATYWDKGEHESCLEIAVEARNFGDAAAKDAAREERALLIVLDVHLGMVIERLRTSTDVTDLMPMTRRFSSALLLLTVAE